MAQRYGNYTVYEPPFEGGFCRVYRATRWDRPGRFFAVKTPLDPASKEQASALKREAKVLGRVRHPNIVKLIEAELGARPPFLVLEYVAGGSLRSQVGRLDYRGVLLVVYQISGALGAFHAAGGFHRDVKPDNLLVGPDGTFILADANVANVPSAASLLTRHVGGTKGYIDPWAVNRGYDAAADIWSLGTTIAELVSGRAPNVCIDPNGLKLPPGALPIPESHRPLFHPLLSAMVNPDPALRPSAALIQQYSLVLLNGGNLPALPVEQSKPKARGVAAKTAVTAGKVIAGAVVGAAALGLIAVGLAALFGEKDEAKPSENPPAKPKKPPAK